MVFGVFLRAIYTFKTLNCTVAYGLWGDFWHLGGAMAPLAPLNPPMVLNVVTRLLPTFTEHCLLLLLQLPSLICNCVIITGQHNSVA